MKKFISLILSVPVASAVCFGAVGCKVEEKIDLPEMTAEAPVYEYIGHFAMPEYLDFETYEEFIEYYQQYKTLSENRFYLLKPEYISFRSNGYYYCKTEDDIEYNQIEEYIQIYDPELNYSKKIGKPQNGDLCSIEISFISITMPKVQSIEDYNFEFGETEFEDYNFDHYVNIYVNDVCISTCYFCAYVSIPLSWFENYFTRNIFYGE